MADKRISQLVERTDIANNDVLPIVASGATTTNKVTVSTLQDWMQENLDVGVTSVGLSMPSAFTVTNSPVTTSGNISVAGAGTVSQYIRGDGSLADFPSISGGGSSVSYYLNGSVSQGTIGGIAYRELNKVPILGTGTDFVAIADGYLASFITDAGDPSLLLIPGGNWNFETYFSASSGGGTPTFYVELYKVDSGGTATLIASNSTAPELIAFGTTITPYFSTLAVPTTTLTLTDRLAIRYYVARSGRTITLHTENGHLCQIITTFTTGLTALNGLTAQVQNFATGTSGSDFNISSSTSTHTFNLPTATSTIRGALSSADWITFNGKQNAITLTTTGSSGAATLVGSTLNIPNYTTAMQNQYVPYTGAIGSVTLGANNMSASNILVDGSTSTWGGFLGFKQASSVNTGQGGYTSISALGTNEIKFSFAQPTNFKEFSFSTQSITAGVPGGRIYTLPDASGTLALTSQLGDYVTIATTQTITGAKTFETTTSTFALMNSTNANGGVLSFRRNGTNVGHIGNSAQLGGGILDAIEVRSGVGSSVILKTDGGQMTLANGGGATFTSLVTANGFEANTTSNGFNINLSKSAGFGALIQLKNTSSSSTELVRVLDSSNNIISQIYPASNGIAITTGSVGIGTLTPGGKLEVKQTANEVPFIIDSSSDANAAYTLYQVNGSGGWETGMARAADGYSYLFSYGSFSAANSKFSLTNTGNASFVGSVTSTGMRSIDASNTWSFSTGSNSSTPNIVALGTISGTPSIQGFNFGFSSNQNLCLQPQSGNVGIGTTSPTTTLDINGSVRYRGSIYNTFEYIGSGNFSNGTYYNILEVNQIGEGIYILEGYVDTFAAGGGIYYCNFVSVPFYIWPVGSNSTTFVDLPPVLGVGHHLGNPFPAFRLQMTLAGAGVFLQFNPNGSWSGINNAIGKTFNVRLKRIGQ
jgi:hypothetical protein